jgi:hypothetical protein
MDKPGNEESVRAAEINHLPEKASVKTAIDPQPRAPTNPGAPAGYMTLPPGGDRDALGRPWPEVKVPERKARRRKR